MTPIHILIGLGVALQAAALGAVSYEFLRPAATKRGARLFLAAAFPFAGIEGIQFIRGESTLPAMGALLLSLLLAGVTAAGNHSEKKRAAARG